jgi:hypothetical protein
MSVLGKAMQVILDTDTENTEILNGSRWTHWNFV